MAAPLGDLNYWEERRRERQYGAVLALTNHHARMQANVTAAWTPSKPGDLVFARDIQKEHQHGRKLDLVWLGSRLLVSLTSSGVSGYVQELYGEKVKRYHLDDVKTYCPRQHPSNTTTIERGLCYMQGSHGKELFF